MTAPSTPAGSLSSQPPFTKSACSDHLPITPGYLSEFSSSANNYALAETVLPAGEPRTGGSLRGSARGLDGHSADHADLTRRGLERVVVSPAPARTPRNTWLTNWSLNSSVNGEVRNRRR